MLGWRLEELGISHLSYPPVGETEAPKVVVLSFLNLENFIGEYCIYMVYTPPFHLFFVFKSES